MFRKNLILAVVIAFAAASTAMAADSKSYRITNNSAASAKALDLTFAGTGGSLRVTVYGQDSPCADGSVNTNQVAGTSTITYPSDCVRVKGLVLIKAETNNGPISITGGNWTDVNNVTTAIALSDAVQITVPTVSQWGLIVLTIALLIAATIIFARRKPAVANA